MPSYQQDLTYNIKTTFDKTGIAQLQAALAKLTTDLEKKTSLNRNNTLAAQAEKDLQAIKKVSTALNTAYNGRTGLLNIGTFNSKLKESRTSISEFSQACTRAGAVGTAAMNSLIGQVTGFQKGIRQTTTLTEKLGTTMSNAVRWGVVSAGFQAVMNSAQQAVNYVKQLDNSLTQITMVSGESRDNMKDFASYANKAAASLSASTTTYTNAVKVFIQEGFSLEQSKQQATQAVTLANVSEQDSSTTADQITAYRNAFNLSISQMDSSLDKIANLANNTASNVGELMTASQRTASTAASVGASQDSMLAAIATIESVTRDSAENIGNGLKSIYTRFADITMGETTSDNVNLNKYSKAMKSAGVDILDSSGQYKGFDQILTELQSAWKTLSDTQKLAVGETVAGRYQYNRFAALMNNSDYYEKAYNATQGASGAMSRMQESYNEGINAQLQKISTNIETLFTQIYNSGSVEELVKGLTAVSDLFSDLADNINGSLPVLSALIALVGKFGGKQIAASISNQMMNFKDRKAEKDNDYNRKQVIQELQASGYGVKSEGNSSAVDKVIGQNVKAYDLKRVFSTEEQQAWNERQGKILSNNAELQDIDDERDQLIEKMRVMLGDENPAVKKGDSADIVRAFSATFNNPQEINKWRKSQYEANSQSLSGISDLEQKMGKYASMEEGSFSIKDMKRDLGNSLTSIWSQTALRDGENAQSVLDVENLNTRLFSEDIDNILSVQKLITDYIEQERDQIINTNKVAQEAKSLLKQNETLDTRTEDKKTQNIALEAQSDEVLKRKEQEATIQDGVSLVSSFAGSVTTVSMAIESTNQAMDVFNDSASTMQEKISALAESMGSWAIVGASFLDILTTLKGTKAGKAFGEAKEIIKSGEGVGKALKTLKPGVSILLKAAAAIGSIVAIFESFQLAEDWTTKDQTAYDNATETISTNETDITSLKENKEELDNSLDSIDDARDKLSELEKGTDEWADSLQSLNSQILELVNQNPELSKYLKNTNGVLSFDETGIKNYQRQQADNIANLTSSNEYLTYAQAKSKSDADIEKYINDQGLPSWTSIGTGVATGALIGAGAGSWIPGVGTAIGALAGAGVGALGGAAMYGWGQNDQTERYSDEIKSLAQELTNKSVDSNSYEFQSKVDDLASKMGTSSESLLQLVTTLATNTAAVDQNTIALTTDNGVAQVDPETLRSVGEQIVGTDTMNQISNGDNLASIDAVKEYAASKVDGLSASDITSIETDDKGQIIVHGAGLDKEGKTLAADSQSLASAVIGYKGSEALKDSIDNVIDQAKLSSKELNADELNDAIAQYLKNVYNVVNVSLESSKEGIAGMANQAGANVSVQSVNSGTPEASGAADSTSLSTLQTDLSISSDVLDEFENAIRAATEATQSDKDATIAAAQAKEDEANQRKTQLENELSVTTNDYDNYKKEMTETGFVNEQTGYTGKLTDDFFTKISALASQIQEEKYTDDSGQQQTRLSTDNLSDEDKQAWDYFNRQAGDDKATKLVEITKKQNSLTKEIKEQSKEADKASKKIDKYNKSTEDIAARSLQAKKGLKQLKEVMDDSYDVLNKKVKGEEVDPTEYATAITQARKGMKDLLGTDSLKQFGGDKFILNNLDDIKSASNGSEEALKRLQTAAVNAFTNSSKFAKAFKGDVSSAKGTVTNLASYLQGLNLDVGGKVDIDTDPYLKKLVGLTSYTWSQAKEMQQALQAAGFEGEFDPKYTVGGKTFKSLKKAMEYLYAHDSSAYDENGNIIKTSSSYLGDETIKVSYKLNSIKDTQANITSGLASSNSSGSGGSKSSKQKKTKADKANDPYQQVNAQLQKQQTILDKLNNSYDRLYGKDRINNIYKQVKAEKTKLKYLGDQAKIADKQLKQNTKYLKDPDTGDKTIKNWTKQYKNLISSDGTINQKVYEKISNKLANIKDDGKKYQAFQTAVQNYNSDLEKVQSTISDIDDAYQEYFDTLLKQQEYIETLKDRTDSLNKSLSNLKTTKYTALNDLVSGISSAANSQKSAKEEYNLAKLQASRSQEKIDNLNAQDKALNKKNIKYNGKTYSLKELMNKYSSFSNKESTEAQKLAKKIEETAKKKGFNYSNLDDFYQALADEANDYADKVQTQIEKAASEVSSVFDRITAIFDAYSDRIDKYSNLSSDYTTLNDIYTLTNGEEDYQTFYSNNKKSYNALSQVSTLYAAQINSAQKVIATLTSQRDNAKTDQEREIAQEQLDEKVTELRDIQSKALSALQSQAEAAKNARDSAIDVGMQNLLKSAFGITSWNSSKLQWEMSKENNDNYYDEYQSNYQKNSLKYSYNQLKNSTKNLNLQNKISKAMKQQMDYLNKRDKLSQFDIEYAQKKLSVLKAQIALEEAQTNKTQLSLNRDSSGNYSYVYSANAEQVEQAQNELEQQRQEAYDLAKEQLASGRDNIESFLDTVSQRLKDNPNDKEAILNSAKTTLQQMYRDQILTPYQLLNSDYGVNSYTELGYAWGDKILGSLDSGKTIDWSALINDWSNSFSQEDTDYKTALESVKTAANNLSSSLDSFSKDLQEGEKTWTETMDEEMQEALKEIPTTMKDLTAALEALSEAIKIMSNAQKQASSTEKSVDKTISRTGWSSSISSSTNKTAAKVAASIRSSMEDEGYGFGSTDHGKTWNKLEKNDKGKAVRDFNIYKGKGLSKVIGTVKKNDTVKIANIGDDWVKILYDNDKKSGYVKLSSAKRYLVGYDTGGYTGDWNGAGVDGKGGKIGILHQKEIVLNKDDTANFLTAVEALRSMQNENDVFAKTLNKIISASTTATNEKVIEQRVEIAATFPSATDANEIREALLSISDKAYQYVN